MHVYLSFLFKHALQLKHRRSIGAVQVVVNFNVFTCCVMVKIIAVMHLRHISQLTSLNAHLNDFVFLPLSPLLSHGLSFQSKFLSIQYVSKCSYQFP
jgi:hypothetical protein